MKQHKTNYRSGDSFLTFSKVTEGLWRVFWNDVDWEPVAVGPFYPTKETLLADLDRYAKEQGFKREGA